MVFLVRCYFILCNSIHLDQSVCAQLFSILLYCTALYCTPSFSVASIVLQNPETPSRTFRILLGDNRNQWREFATAHSLLCDSFNSHITYMLLYTFPPTSSSSSHSIPSSLPLFSFLFFASLTSDIRSEQQQSSVSPSVKGPLSSKASSRYDRLWTCQGAILLRYHWQNRQESHSSERKRGSKCFPSFLSFFLFNMLPSPMRNVCTTLSSSVLSFRRWVIRSSTRCHHPYLFHF